MNRIDRLSAIIILLQSKHYISAEDIAERFDISVRTVYRDLKALEEAGVPISIETGRGYFLVDGYHLPPVMFTKDEASAFIVAEKLLAQNTDPSIFKQYQSALTKIRAVLKNEEKLMAEELDTRISVTSYSNHKMSHGYMAEILQAIASKVKLNINYHALYNNTSTTRIIDPIGIINYGLDWHLIAFCNLRKDYRDFRITRIKELKQTNQKFEQHDNYSLSAYYQHLSNNSDLEQVKVCFDKTILQELGTLKYYHGLISEKETEKGTEMVFATNSLEYTAKWLLSFTGKVDIISPDQLKTILINYTRDLKEKYLDH